MHVNVCPVFIFCNAGLMAHTYTCKRNKRSEKLLCVVAVGLWDTVQFLVDSGADVDSQDKCKVSCLMAASKNGHVELVQKLLKLKKAPQFPSDQELLRVESQLADEVCSLFSLPFSVS